MPGPDQVGPLSGLSDRTKKVRSYYRGHLLYYILYIFSTLSRTYQPHFKHYFVTIICLPALGVIVITGLDYFIKARIFRKIRSIWHLFVENHKNSLKIKEITLIFVEICFNTLLVMFYFDIEGSFPLQLSLTPERSEIRIQNIHEKFSSISEFQMNFKLLKLDIFSTFGSFQYQRLDQSTSY